MPGQSSIQDIKSYVERVPSGARSSRLGAYLGAHLGGPLKSLDTPGHLWSAAAESVLDVPAHIVCMTNPNADDLDRLRLLLAEANAKLQAATDLISLIAASSPPAIELDTDLFTVNEAVSYLRTSRSSLYVQMRNGGLPSVHIGGRRLLRRGDLDAWLESHSTSDAQAA